MKILSKSLMIERSQQIQQKHTIRKSKPILKTLILGSIIFLPIGLGQAVNAQNIKAQTLVAQNCIDGRNGTCIPDKTLGKGQKIPPKGQIKKGSSSTPKKGNPCNGNSSSSDCNKWVNEGYKPKPRPK